MPETAEPVADNVRVTEHNALGDQFTLTGTIDGEDVAYHYDASTSRLTQNIDGVAWIIGPGPIRRACVVAVAAFKDKESTDE